MILNDIISKIKNGSAHVLAFNADTGEILFQTIWYNQIPEQYLNCEVDYIQVLDFKLRIGIKC